MSRFRAGADGDDVTSEYNPAPERAAITVEDVSLSFGDLSVLEDVSLTIESGEFVGFVGPNGAGKTTLLRAISGALEPDSGTVTIGDTDVHRASAKASSRLVSVVPQDTTLSFSFPIRDVVEMGRHPHRSRFSSPTLEDREAVEQALERTRTVDLADRPIDEVSGGQRQRVVLARAIAQETPAMLLDEPTGSLDVNHQIETLQLVRELVEEGRAVCAAIHDLDLAARYCDRLVMLADGQLFRSGTPANVLTGASLSDVFDATATVTTNPITGTETVTALPKVDGSDSRDSGDGSAVRVHVLGTGSLASSVLARLETATAELDLSVGPVTAGDTAAETARSLDLERLEIPPFESLSPTDLTAFEDRIRESDLTVVIESVVKSGGVGSRQLVETVDSVADSVVFVTEADGDQSEEDSDVLPNYDRSRMIEATPETILESVDDALENGSQSAYSRSDSGSSETGSSSDGDSSTGVSAESSGD
ncbi:heme ABC transporter ATP-binding protein [Natronorubrum texcoconense]|uniref:Cobalamin import ATP-binding protein BtuD n=1 Tax=Natronorubrum texcoconense TaxID=1095776 RepID=A0A1G8ZPA8_9EURY|nr:heme ABC transporter ATP-binding protein [Natronorubrum texcoconense]SDK15990.1 iron complex transport system ATP-binding protein [Natronorubrum texcoconense]